MQAAAIDNTDAKTLMGFVHKHIEPDSTILANNSQAYHGLADVLYNHVSVKHFARGYVNGIIRTNGIKSVRALIKRGHTGTFHHFSLKHLQRYVDEFKYRLNEGNCQRDTIDRIKSVCAGSTNKRLTYKDLTA